jgi:hypothetical protein
MEMYKKKNRRPAARQLAVVCDYSKLFECASPSGATEAERPRPRARRLVATLRRAVPGATRDAGCGAEGSAGTAPRAPGRARGRAPQSLPPPPARRVVATLRTCRAYNEGCRERAPPTAQHTKFPGRAATMLRVPPGRGRGGSKRRSARQSCAARRTSFRGAVARAMTVTRRRPARHSRDFGAGADLGVQRPRRTMAMTGRTTSSPRPQSRAPVPARVPKHRVQHLPPAAQVVLCRRGLRGASWGPLFAFMLGKKHVPFVSQVRTDPAAFGGTRLVNIRVFAPFCLRVERAFAALWHSPGCRR